jgi:hypothetical protein
LTRSNISVEPSWSGRQAFIGCRAFPTLDCVREAIASTGDSFRAFVGKSSNWADHWNMAVLHVIWHQQFAIGARSSRQLYIASSAFNTESGLARLSDKDNKNCYKTRLVWMPPALVCQMRELEKAHSFIIMLGKAGRPPRLPFDELKFLFDKSQCRPESVTREGIIRVSREFFPFPVNTPRRVMRYLLKNRGLSPEYVDVFMGHWRERREPWGKWSSLDYSDYLACLRQLVPEILSDLGFGTRPDRKGVG